MSLNKAVKATKTPAKSAAAPADKPKRWTKGMPVTFDAATRTGVRATGSGHVIRTRDLGRAGVYVDIKTLDGKERSVRPSQLTAAAA